MAMQVLIAHTGQRLELEGSPFSTLDDFRAAVTRATSIPAKNVIALTPQGKPVRSQSLAVEKEIYIYDSRLTTIQPGASSTSGSKDGVAEELEVDLPSQYLPEAPPNTIHDTRSLQSWQELFAQRAEWAGKITDECAELATTTQTRYSEMDVMMRCLDAAVANLESVVDGVKAKYEDVKGWADPAMAEQAELVAGREGYLRLANSIPVSVDMVDLMTDRGLKSQGNVAEATLQDLLDADTVSRAGKLAPQALEKFRQRVQDLGNTAQGMTEQSEQLTTTFDQIVARSVMSHDDEAVQLLQDIEAIAKKVETDNQAVAELSNSTKDVLQASKLAAGHTERLLPSIKARAREMNELLHYATKQRNALAIELVELMRSITSTTSKSTNVKTRINDLSQAEELSTFDYLRLMQQVPYLYASFVVEAIRRREWYEKVSSDSTTLANEMAMFQEEEVKRRKKWQKSVEDAYGPQTAVLEGNVPGLEVNMAGADGKWPNMTREDLLDFIAALRRQQADSQVIDDVKKLVADMSNPTKQQSRRLKAFKNGSMHEAGLGRSGLLIRGDDDIFRSLQEEKAKAEGKLKTAESRVRRLEDLLHRQEQHASRPSIGGMFQMPSQQSLQNGLRSPQMSPAASEDAMHRIRQLEEELNAERQRATSLKQDLQARTTEHQNVTSQMADVTSTKQDLLQNMETQQREFIEERKSLEDEIRQLKARLEETEEDIEHFGESRENEKAGFSEKVLVLESELSRMRKEARDQAQKYEGQVDFLRKEAKTQRELGEGLEKELRQRGEDVKLAMKRHDDLQDGHRTLLEGLQHVHDALRPNMAAPTAHDTLIEVVTSSSAQLMSQVGDMEAELALLKSDRDAQQSSLAEAREQISSLTIHSTEEQSTTMRLRQDFAAEEAKKAVLDQQLGAARKQLDELRAQLSDGETGSETLRRKLEADEKKITDLTEDLAAQQSKLGSLEEEMHHHKSRAEDVQAKLDTLHSRLARRTDRTKELTQKVYSQNERLFRLLEKLGFAVAKHDDKMTITKIPRNERSVQNLSDSNDAVSLMKTLSNGDPGDLDLLYWMNSQDVATEDEKYDAFMSTYGHFDNEAFSEAVQRRVKDMEHTARKWQREAKAYREKFHRVEKEAHEKIAFKNFKDGDLALFLPTRNQTTGAWAAFNIGFPHYFLKEKQEHDLRKREWLLARISRIQGRTVDLSKVGSQQQSNGDLSVPRPKHDTGSINDEHENPFDLSDGLHWYLVDAAEDQTRAPSTPGLGKSTVAANTVEAVAERSHSRSASGSKGLGLIAGRSSAATGGIDGVSKSLSKSLESRRSSTSSRRALPFAKSSALANVAIPVGSAVAETGDGSASLATSPVVTAGGMAAPMSPKKEQAKLNVHGNATDASGAPEQQRLLSPTKQRSPQQSLQRDVSNASTVESPSKKSVVWDSLWSYDVSFGESGGKKNTSRT